MVQVFVKPIYWQGSPALSLPLCPPLSAGHHCCSGVCQASLLAGQHGTPSHFVRLNRLVVIFVKVFVKPVYCRAPRHSLSPRQFLQNKSRPSLHTNLVTQINISNLFIYVAIQKACFRPAVYKNTSHSDLSSKHVSCIEQPLSHSKDLV